MAARICICDDDPMIAEVLGRHLSAAGLEVQEPLSSVEQAMGWLSVDPPDLLLLDLNMPAGGGLDLLGWLKAQRHLDRMDVLMLTGEDDLWFIDRARRLGARGYLTKPVDAAALVARVRRLLENRRVAWMDDHTALTLPGEPHPAPACADPGGGQAALERLSPTAAGMARTYGEPVVVGLLRSLAEQLARMDDVAEGAADPGRTAHAIRGAAASLGFEAVADACAALEAACRTGVGVDPLLRRAADACARTRREITTCLDLGP